MTTAEIQVADPIEGFCQYPTRLTSYGLPADTCRAPAVEFRPDRLYVRYVCAEHA